MNSAIVLCEYLGVKEDPVFTITIRCEARIDALFSVWVDEKRQSQDASANYGKVKDHFDVVVSVFKAIYRKHYGYSHCEHCGEFVYGVKHLKIHFLEGGMKQPDNYESELCPKCFILRKNDGETVSIVEVKDE